MNDQPLEMEFAKLPGRDGTSNPIMRAERREQLTAWLPALRANRGAVTAVDRCATPAPGTRENPQSQRLVRTRRQLLHAADEMGVTDFRAWVRSVDGVSQLFVGTVYQ